ncbi:FGGY-family carbohydrate kinase [Chitinophaga sp. MM2321]|uniref:FGGY-family carbohydrate kinase n=1 Tax=Chitinophaga sp. MM2321 TaxID=3137178 RepID=UPI0032D56E01
MNHSTTHSAFAAIDIGTTNIKCGVAIVGINNSFRIIGSWRNETVSAFPGQALNSFSKIEAIVMECLKHLGQYCLEQQVKKIHIGISGHVSSYLNWDKDAAVPVNDFFPIWSDHTCEPALPGIRTLFKDNSAEQYLGTFLPPATNWLVTKILHHHQHNNAGNHIILQISDAIFHRLTGGYFTHFSTAVSLCHRITRAYSKDILDALNISTDNLPEVSNDRFFTMLEMWKKKWSLPTETFVFPGVADFYASFAALDLKQEEGFILSNSSEIAGKRLGNEQVKSDRFLQTCLQQNESILYGSTQTGGNLISWFFEKIYRQPLNYENLTGLSTSTLNISPLSCPLFIPYLEGERAPFWNNHLSGGFINLKTHHDMAHLFKAVLTGVAFARRLSFESMPGNSPAMIKIGGGGARNNVWNQLRADVMGKPLLVFQEAELSILGTILLMAAELKNDDITNYIAALQQTDRLNPDMRMTDLYVDQYSQFIRYTKSF